MRFGGKIRVPEDGLVVSFCNEPWLQICTTSGHPDKVFSNKIRDSLRVEVLNRMNLVYLPNDISKYFTFGRCVSFSPNVFHDYDVANKIR